MDAVVGVDVGGTTISAAVVASDGRPQAIRSVPTPAQAGPQAMLDTIARLVREVIELERLRPDGQSGRVVALGVGTAGIVDVARGSIVSSTDAIRGWAGTAVATGLRDRLGLPVIVENDVDAHAVGEAWLGAAAGAPSALMVAVGTGVGACVVLAGRALRGAHHVAGEMGHMPARGAEGLRCPCGRMGHLEAIGSGPGLHRHYVALGGDPDCRDARGVVARAHAGEELAMRAVRDAARALGRSIAGVVTVVDPAVVVIGGGLSGAGELWWSTMEATLRSEVIDALADLVVAPATLGAAAPIVGAARAAWRLIDDGSVPPDDAAR
ncbi:MAG: ROK family protein [Micrococcales bacterium]|nr:ROK family protein [Micrococcales bacterium]